MISDRRKLRIYQVISTDGELTLEQSADCWQDDKGVIQGGGLWYDLVVPCPEDLEAQAKVKNISALEWLRQKLTIVTYLKIDIL